MFFLSFSVIHLFVIARVFMLGFNRKGRKGFARDAMGCFSRKGTETQRFASLLTCFCEDMTREVKRGVGTDAFCAGV